MKADRSTRYSDEQKQAFCERAAQIGLSAAVQELGYPSVPTATGWLRQFGVNVQLSALQQNAAQVRQWYGHAERMLALQTALDRAYELLTLGEPVDEEDVIADPATGEIVLGYKRKPLNASALRNVASVVKSTVEAMEVLDGRVSGRTELVVEDATSAELRALIERARADNARMIERFRQPQPQAIAAAAQS